MKLSLFLLFISLNLISFNNLYFFQLKGYFKSRFLKFKLDKINHLLIFSVIFDLFILIFLNDINIIKNIILYLKISNFSYFIIFIKQIIIYLFLIFYNIYFIFKSKKVKFNPTFRIKRLFFILNVFYFIFTIFFINLNETFNLSLILCFYLIFLTSIIICLADFVDLYKYYLNITSIKKAKKFIKNTSAIKIGITGTNGKTSIKNYLNKILSVKFKTVATPKNYNTPKGIISTINSINSEVDCLIFEMGARQKNDIKKLCCLTNIDLGIISNVSCQHLETFKSIDNIYKTKKELSDFLNKKLCVYNYNNVHTRHMYKTKTGDKFIIAVFERYSPHIKQNKIIKLNKKSNYMCFYSREYKINLYANNIHLNNGSTHFTIHYCNKTFLAETKLLGTHNISNLLLASAIALNLDIDIQTIINKISEITPVEHRLQLIKGRLNILDDSYNCSLESAKASLNVLKEFDGLKIVCTPGIIEGGKNQDYLNSCLFEEIEKVADVIIIIGKTNLKTFKNKMSKKIVYYLDNLDQAKPYFNKFKDGSTLLILNDLPDDYT